MVDLEEVDRRLGELGAPPADLRALLERALGANRSRERLDALLGELDPERKAVAHEATLPPAAEVTAARGAEVSTTDPPPPRSGVSVEAEGFSPPAPPERPPAPAASAQRVATLAPQPLAPPLEPAEPSAEPARETAPPAFGSEPSSRNEEPHETAASFAALFDLSDPPPPRVSDVPGSEASGRDEPAAEQDAERARRSSMRALLEQDLDPEDFPSTPEVANAPDGAEPAQAQPAAEPEEDFELLVDDEVIEIVEDELEIVEGEDDG